MIWLPLILIALAVALLWSSRKQHKATGLPEGPIEAADMGQWQPNSRVLYDPRLHLAGKPDYLVRQNGVLIPVEIKTGRTPTRPYDSHVFQLAAYGHLVTVATGTTPPKGVLVYPEKTFEIAFTPDLQASLEETLTEMQAHLRGETVARSHASATRCTACGYREICDQRIG